MLTHSQAFGLKLRNSVGSEINRVLTTSYLHKLTEKITKKQAVIAVIGMGYVGLPLAKTCSNRNFPVIGYDINQSHLEKIRTGKSPFAHFADDYCLWCTDSSKITLTSQAEDMRKADVFIICVPTPITKNFEPDLSYVLSVIDSILPLAQQGSLISLESTTFPGTTDQIIAKKFEENGFKVGTDIFIGYSPEREDPGNAIFSTENIPKLTAGITASCQKVMELLYSQFVQHVVSVKNTRTAEMAKIVENTQRLVNIALVNELKVIAEKLNIDIFEVIDAASTKPFGFTPYYPGPGVGGHCIPIDPHYISWKSKEVGVFSRFIELATIVNSSMPDYVVKKISESLNSKALSINGSRILLLGLAYKPNVSDVRESSSMIIMEKLLELGGEMSYHDPFVPKVTVKKKKITNSQLTKELLEQSDIVVVATHHDNFDYQFISSHSRLIVDTRGVYRNLSDKVVRA